MSDVSTTPRRPMSPTRRLRIWEQTKGVCILCGERIDGVREPWTVEHIQPLGLGGADDDSNCGPAHERCRRGKDKADMAAIAKAKRQKARHIGVKRESRWPKPPDGYGYDWSRRRYVKMETTNG